MQRILRDQDAELPLRPVRLGPTDCVHKRASDGTLTLRSPHELPPYPNNLTDRLTHWANATPERLFIADRGVDGVWRKLSYSDTLSKVRNIGEALLRRNLGAERPLVILSGNDLEHQLLGLAAMYVGIPYAPVSPAYSLISSDFGKLRYIINLLTPGLVFASDGCSFARAIASTVPVDVERVIARNAVDDRSTPFSDLVTSATDAVDRAHAATGPDTIAKFLFTSGSTGHPKGVINTQRMLCANQAMIRVAEPCFEDEPPIIVDWAPWHHTAGGNHNIGISLFNGGSFYVDDGKPMPGAIEATVRNLREVAPTWYFNVPKGYEVLLPYLRADSDLRRTFFSRLKIMFYAGAGIAQHIADELQRLAYATCGERILLLTSLGSTETAPMAIIRTWESERASNIGLPAVGLELKLVPCDGKFEARLRGPNITPGYWREPELTAEAFDEDGFYRMGDALRFADPENPARGLLFDGRIAEDFKLATGTWVRLGPIRSGFIDHFAPYVRDVVIAGPDRDDLVALVFPDVEACRRLAPKLAADAAAQAILADARVVKEFEFLLRTLAAKSTGSSNRVCRAILLSEPPSLDVGEVTDKGSINQRAVLKHRAALVDALYTVPKPPQVIAIAENPQHPT
jgi:feruloyl-CoA synthase